MKKFLASVFLFSFLFSGAGALADSNINTKKSSDKKTSAKEAAAMESEADKQKTEEDRRAELNNSEWDINIYAKGADPSKPEKDKLVFRDGTLLFKSFGDKGYPAAGYSLVVDSTLEGGTWESNILGKDEARLSVRGDWRKSVMNGVMTEQLKDEKTYKTYYFSSQVKKVLTPAEIKEGQPAVPAAAEVPKALVA